MEYLSHCRKTSLRWIADARRAGTGSSGMRWVENYVEQLELDMPDLKAAEPLEDMEVRSEMLSDAHHSLVAKRVEDPEKQKEWLEVSEKEGLSPRELATSISCGRIVRADEQDSRKAGITTIEGVRGMFDIWGGADEGELEELANREAGAAAGGDFADCGDGGLAKGEFRKPSGKRSIGQECAEAECIG